jgi:hypothetical protein
MELTIRTNGHRYPLLMWEQLTRKEQRELDWIKNPLEETGLEFFRYRNWVYCLSDFMRIEHGAPDNLQGWDGYKGDSFFSGVLVKYADDGESVVCATYYS